MRPALPVAHLARVKPAEILRPKRAAEQREREQQRDQPGDRRRLHRRRGRGPQAVASLILPRFLARRCPKRPPRGAGPASRFSVFSA